MTEGVRDSPPRNPFLSMALFRLDEQRYALPLAAVERVLPMVAVSPLPQTPAIALGVINVHGTVIPVLDFRRRVNLPSREIGISGHLLIARTARRTVGLPVDEVLGAMEVDAQTVTGPQTVLPGIGQVTGIATLADGLLFIYDLDAFLSLEEELQLADALQETGG